MKTIRNTLVLLVVLAVVAWGLTLRSRYNDNLKELAQMKVVVDSIRAIEAMPPDTISIVRDTTIYKDTTIYVVKEFEKQDSGDEVNHYRDSLVNDEIRVWADIYAEKLFNVEWRYQPVLKKQFTTIREPYPVIVEKPIEVNTEASGIYATGGIGFGDGFVGRVGLGYMPDSRKMYGVEVMKVGDKTIYGGFAAFKLFK
jgi:hypothetical protein